MKEECECRVVQYDKLMTGGQAGWALGTTWSQTVTPMYISLPSECMSGAASVLPCTSQTEATQPLL